MVINNNEKKELEIKQKKISLSWKININVKF